MLDLAVLGRGIGVRHDAGAGLRARLAALRQRERADGETAVEIAREVVLDDGAGVEAARLPLQARDDLHGADLRRAAHGAGREGRREGVPRGLARIERALD